MGGGGGGEVKSEPCCCTLTPPGLNGWPALQIMTWEGEAQSAEVDMLRLDLSGQTKLRAEGLLVHHFLLRSLRKWREEHFWGEVSGWR